MSAVQSILKALWTARQARKARGFDLAAQVKREFYRRDLAQRIRAEFTERYDRNTAAGRRWVTIGGHGEEGGGTHVQIDGAGQIVKGPPSLQGKPADHPDAPAKPKGQDVNDTLSFDETAANKSLAGTGKASHAGHSAEIVEHPEGRQWGYAAKVTSPGGEVSHVSNKGQNQGTSWREAQSHALGALKSASPPGDQTDAKAGGKAQETTEKQASTDGGRFTLAPQKNKEHQPAEHQGQLFDTGKPPKGSAKPSQGQPAARGGNPRLPAGVVETPDGRRLGATQLPVSDLKADPKRFQYKISGIDEKTGVTKELSEVSSFNPMFAGQLLVWHDPSDGQTYVVNGHHRFELAKRSGYGGKLAVFYVDEPKPEGARAMGALANIAEGRGTAIDAAKFMRDSGKSVGDLQGAGISLQGKIAADGAVLSRVSDKIFQDVANGLTTENRALAIGRHISKPDVQEQCYRMLQRKESGAKAKGHQR